MHAFEAMLLVAQQASSSMRRTISLFLLVVLLVLVAIAMLTIYRAIRRRLHHQVKGRSRATKPRRHMDAWAEAGRRVPLEDDPDVPREPPDDAPHERGFS